MKLKKILAIIMAALMIFSAVPFASAADTADEIIADGSTEKADYKALDDSIALLKEILETPELTEGTKAYLQEAIDRAEATDRDLTKSDEDTAILLSAVFSALVAAQNVKDKIADGSALKANYKSLDDAIALLKEILETPDLTEEFKAYLQEAIDLAEATDRDLTQSDKDTNVFLSAVFSALVAAQNVKDAIKNGAALKADFTEIDARIEEIEEYLGDESLSEELTKEFEDLKAFLEVLKADPTATQYEVRLFISDLEAFEEDVRAEREDNSIYYWLWKLIEAVIEFLTNLKW